MTDETKIALDPLLAQVVLTFQTAAYQHMGKIANPVTGKVERNLSQAQNAIDILDMLKTKTSGNLTAEETKMLDRALLELRMNYLDEVKRAEQQPQTAEKPAKEKEDSPPAPDEKPAQADR